MRDEGTWDAELHRRPALSAPPDEPSIQVRASGMAGRDRALGFMDPGGGAARALGVWRSERRRPGRLFRRALGSMSGWRYLLLFAGSAALYLLILGLYVAGPSDKGRPTDRSVFAKPESPADAPPAPTAPVVPSGLDMVVPPPLPEARPTHSPPPPPAAPAPKDGGKPDWAAPIALAAQGDAPPPPPRQTLTLVSLPGDPASKAASAAVLMLAKAAPAAEPAASAPSNRPAPRPRAGRREFRDLSGVVYYH